MQIIINQQTFILSPFKILFWAEQKWLIISDAHFAKEVHFRKNGIAVPAGILQTDLKKIDLLIHQFQPAAILFLGDMFHSEENEGLHEFMQWRKKQNIEMHLVIGNHDILSRDWYGFAGINLHENIIQSGQILFSHEKLIIDDEGIYNFSGHIHPSIRMHGKARQSLRMPCFWFGKQHGVLPAFGSFTGSKSVRPNKEDQIFAVGENEIFHLQ